MGKIVELEYKRIIPTQDEIHDQYVVTFVRSYLRNPQDPIIPIKRTLEGDLLLDGHHCAASMELISKLTGAKIYGWIAENEEDLIENLPEMFHQHPHTINEKNRNIQKRFNLKPSKSCQQLGDLRKKYSFMESPKKLVDFSLNHPEMELNNYRD